MRRVTRPGLRVLITTDCVGGVWRYVMDVSRELATRGAEVGVACLGPAPDAGKAEEAHRAGVELHPLDVPLDWTAEGPDALRAGAGRLEALARAWSPTVLHLNTPAVAGFLMAPIPRVVAAHSCVATWWSAVRDGPLPDRWSWYIGTTRAGLRAADVVVVPTRAFAEALRTVYGPLPHLRVIRNGSAPVRSDAKAPFALAIGRWWDDAKNARVLDAAAAIATCPVYAAGPLRGPTGASADLRNVRWLGELSHADLRRWIGKAPIFVSPALYEPFGLAALEAASAGAALVLSAIPTFRELWNGCAAFAPANDPAAFAAGIDRLADDPVGHARLSRAARARASNWTVPQQVNALIGAYATAVSSHSRAA